jgi:hypothetical protein
MPSRASWLWATMGTALVATPAVADSPLSSGTVWVHEVPGEDCGTQVRCRSKLVEELDRIAGDVCTPGSSLHRLLTTKP